MDISPTVARTLIYSLLFTSSTSTKAVHDKRGSVYAFSSELDTWLQGCKVGLEEEEKELGAVMPVDRKGDHGPFRGGDRERPDVCASLRWRGKCVHGIGLGFYRRFPGETRVKAMSAARKALELNRELAEAHTLLAGIQLQGWHWAEAESEYKRALELKPSDAVAWLEFAAWLLCQGRTEALAWAQRARAHDPLAVSGVGLGWILFHARRYDEAIHELRSVLAVQPNHVKALWFLGFTLIANGQAEEAIPVLEKTLSVSGQSPAVMGVPVRAYAHAGRRTDALRPPGELKRRQLAG